MKYVTINEKGAANLKKWLATVLKSGDMHAGTWSQHVANAFDGSYQGQIEVGSFHTASGHPEIYIFDADELDEHEIED